MNAKHLTKNALSRKLVFLAAAIAIAIVAAFSICATSQAKAEENDLMSNGKLTIETDAQGVNLEVDVSNWVEDGSPPTLDYHGYWESGVDIIEEWSVGHSITKATYWVEDSSSNKIVIRIFDNANYYRSLEFNVGDSPIANHNWRINNEVCVPEVMQKEISLSSNVVISYSSKAPALGINISGLVLDEQTNMPVPFAQVAYCQYDPWWGTYIPVEGVEPVQTDMWGFYTLEGITDEMRPGKVLAGRLGYVFDGGQSDPVGWWLPEGLETIWRSVYLTPVPDVDLADVEINGGQHHANFVTTYELYKDGKVVESDTKTLNKINHKVPVGSSYAVYDDGTLHCSYAFPENGDSTVVAYTVKAVAEEGYTLDKWTINGEDLIPGKDYILKTNDVMGLASYKLAEQPVPPVPPAPGPTPVNPGGGTAQTGDVAGYAFAVFAMMALLSAGILAGRKLYNR